MPPCMHVVTISFIWHRPLNNVRGIFFFSQSQMAQDEGKKNLVWKVLRPELLSYNDLFEQNICWQPGNSPKHVISEDTQKCNYRVQ